jgi:hypothetical protein
MTQLLYDVTALCFYKKPDIPNIWHNDAERHGCVEYIGIIQKWRMGMDKPGLDINEDPDCDSIVDKGLDEAVALEVRAHETAPKYPWHDQSMLECDNCVIQDARLLNGPNSASPIIGEIEDRVSNILMQTEQFKEFEPSDDDTNAHDLAKDIVGEVIAMYEELKND